MFRTAGRLHRFLHSPPPLNGYISYGEIYEGLLRRVPNDLRIRQFDDFVSIVELIVPSVEVARHYAAVRADLRVRGLPIPDNDLWIAATAIVHERVLVSRDSHFTRINGLHVYK